MTCNGSERISQLDQHSRIPASIEYSFEVCDHDLLSDFLQLHLAVFWERGMIVLYHQVSSTQVSRETNIY